MIVRRARLSSRPLPFLLAPLVAILAGCGGGSGTTATTTPPASLTLQGTVAVGAPMTAATVTVMDATGRTASAAVQDDGSYSGLSLDGMTAPFRIQACGFVNGGSACYYAVAGAGGTANVTPLTQAAVTLALGQDASTLFNGAAAPSASDIADQQSKLAAALGPVLTAAGVDPSTLDFTTTAFTADRSGMDKVLDSLKISVGADGTTGAFVQVEGNLASGNVYMDSSGTNSGTLQAGSSDIDLTGISTLFNALASGVGQHSTTACTSTLQSAGIFDPAFFLRIDGGTAMTATTAPAGLCSAVDHMGMMGGTLASPVLNDCDSAAGGDTVCTIGFDIVDKTAGETFSGAQLAVVQRAGSTAWALLGADASFEVHVNANAQQRVRADLASADVTYSRAISFDIATTSNDGTQTAALAKVYQHSADGTGWDATPIAVLDVPASCDQPRLSIHGSSCGSTWMSVDGWGSAGADGDALIDAFYKRGRKVRIDIFSDAAGAHPVATLYKRVDGVPPKSTALPSQQWPTIGAASLASLVSLGASDTSYSFDWTSPAELHDATFCLSGDCSTNATRLEVEHGGAGSGSVTLSLSSSPASAAAFKELSLYARDRDGLGLATNYVSCGGASDDACR